MAGNESTSKMANAPDIHNNLEKTLTASGKQFNVKRLATIGGGLILIAIASFVVYKATSTSQLAAQEKAAKLARTIPVTVAAAEIKSVPLTIHNIGNVDPYSVVNVLPQVGGQLMSVHFKQGDYVKAGDLLFMIDPRPYQASLAQAEGNVAKDRSQIAVAQANMAKDSASFRQAEANLHKDQATEKLAKVETERYSNLVKQGAVSQEQADQESTAELTASATIAADRANVQNTQAVVNADKANIESAQATLASDQAAADNAKINLGFTEIRSPINGRTGALNVYQGNVVVANANTPLVSIMQVEPIYVTFSVPEKDLPSVRQAQVAGSLKVEALIEGNKSDRVAGMLSFVDNTVDKTTGTIRLRGTFPNTDHQLWPGEFVNVVLTLGQDANALVIPSQAVQTGQDGTAVFVLQSDNTVAYKPVQVSRTQKDLSVITSGLKPGDVVITDGQLQLTPGAPVKVTNGSGNRGK